MFVKRTTALGSQKSQAKTQTKSQNKTKVCYNKTDKITKQ